MQTARSSRAGAAILFPASYVSNGYLPQGIGFVFGTDIHKYVFERDLRLFIFSAAVTAQNTLETVFKHDCVVMQGAGAHTSYWCDSEAAFVGYTGHYGPLLIHMRHQQHAAFEIFWPAADDITHGIFRQFIGQRTDQFLYTSSYSHEFIAGVAESV